MQYSNVSSFLCLSNLTYCLLMPFVSASPTQVITCKRFAGGLCVAHAYVSFVSALPATVICDMSDYQLLCAAAAAVWHTSRLRIGLDSLNAIRE